ncbi:hypothetical protein IB394_005002 [Escherichia coli]|jgi:hypothetical protein|uniref:hypothetical protein n=1 Tax=Escherichia coli TaxID=562 RepID=UPI000F866153|nr:hypothetical protein [Escherichia coli]EER7685327.1 hypothetical protein [Escherichia coli]EER9322908.1 hypothetical protein [Escherichia coli]EER9510060.1 hypothetical protein [Escherichia coli]EFH6853859.1 hypothetical protein [Escherichia coli]EFI8984590.1 hypothetical protein [Escherichia coli]
MSKILFDPENMSIDEMIKEIHLLRNSRDLALELVFSYPEAKAAEKIVLTDEEISLLKAKLPEHHFQWLSGDGAPVTVGRLGDFADLADDFSILAGEIDPELEEPPEEVISREPGSFVLCLINDQES